MTDKARSKAERCPTCDLPSTWRNRTCDDPFHEDLRGEDERRWTIGVCPVCNRPGPIWGQCLGPHKKQHAPTPWERIEVVPADKGITVSSPPMKGEEKHDG